MRAYVRVCVHVCVRLHTCVCVWLSFIDNVLFHCVIFFSLSKGDPVPYCPRKFTAAQLVFYNIIVVSSPTFSQNYNCRFTLLNL